MLQKLYWQRESLLDDAWRLERKLDRHMRRGYDTTKVLAQISIVRDAIASLDKAMAMIERENGGLLHAQS